MKNKEIKILAIETSCDETAASVIGEKDGKPVIFSSVVNSQIDLHAKTGGVVPEVASRAHMENIVPVISEALLGAKNSKHETRMFETNSNDKNSKQFKKFENSDLNNVSDLDIRISDLYFNAINYLQQNIDYIAVTNGPGLIGSLLVGFNAAKAMAYALDKPIIPVNHIEGHIYSALGEDQKWTTNKTNHEKSIALSGSYGSLSISEFAFPILALTVSGGHTSLTVMRDHGKYERIGGTIDDAAGEAFDKVAKLLGLGYPGGPIVSRMAEEYRKKQERKANKTDSEKSVSRLYNFRLLARSRLQRTRSIPENNKIVFPRPILNDGTFNFSFSGLKTAVLQKVLDLKKENQLHFVVPASHSVIPAKAGIQSGFPIGVGNDGSLSLEQKQEICAAFEDAVVDVLVTKAMRAVEKFKPKAVVLAGGVAANTRLRSELADRIQNTSVSARPSLDGDNSIKFLPAPKDLTGDNAAMIGLAAFYHLQKGNVSNWENIEIDSNLELNNTDL